MQKKIYTVFRKSITSILLLGLFLQSCHNSAIPNPKSAKKRPIANSREINAQIMTINAVNNKELALVIPNSTVEKGKPLVGTGASQKFIQVEEQVHQLRSDYFSSGHVKSTSITLSSRQPAINNKQQLTDCKTCVLQQNSPLSQLRTIQARHHFEQRNSELPVKELLEKKFTTKQRYNVTFYQELGELKARVIQKHPCARRLYLPTYMGDTSLITISGRHIHVKLPEQTENRNGYVFIGKIGLMGGMMEQNSDDDEGSDDDNDIEELMKSYETTFKELNELELSYLHTVKETLPRESLEKEKEKELERERKEPNEENSNSALNLMDINIKRSLLSSLWKKIEQRLTSSEKKNQTLTILQEQLEKEKNDLKKENKALKKFNKELKKEKKASIAANEQLEEEKNNLIVVKERLENEKKNNKKVEVAELIQRIAQRITIVTIPSIGALTASPANIGITIALLATVGLTFVSSIIRGGMTLTSLCVEWNRLCEKWTKLRAKWHEYELKKKFIKVIKAIPWNLITSVFICIYLISIAFAGSEWIGDSIISRSTLVGIGAVATIVAIIIDIIYTLYLR